MELDYLKTLPLGGFSYDNCIRNKAMVESGLTSAPKTMKTGTTICGIIFKVLYHFTHQISLLHKILIPHCQDGVVLAADTRATGGSIVGDKNCEKIHNLAPNIFCCGAGTAADCDHVTGT